MRFGYQSPNLIFLECDKRCLKGVNLPSSDGWINAPFYSIFMPSFLDGKLVQVARPG